MKSPTTRRAFVYTRHMRITVFGASGKVGRRVVELALVQGHTVVAVVHEHNIFTGTPNLIIKKADVYRGEDVAAAIKDSDAVVSCLGSWGTPKRNVLTTAMHTLIPAMQQQKILRIVTLTGSGAANPQRRVGLTHRLIMALMAPFPAGKVFRDGEDHMQLLKQSDLDWTTIRSPIMTSWGSAQYRLSLKQSIHFVTISRRAVAQAMVDQLTADDFLQQAPIIHAS